MLWRLLLFPFTLTLSVLLVVLLGFGTFADREREHFDTLRDQQIELLELRLQDAFASADARVTAQRDVYTLAHRWVEQQLLAGITDLAALSSELASSLQMHVDIYLISSDLVIYDTTFEPDLGLDFNAPMFKDAQAAFARVDSSPEVDIGGITREIVSGDFKIYTLSRLLNGNYLELGFVDPQLARIYQQAERDMLGISSVERVSLFLDVNQALLSPLTDSGVERPQGISDKAALAEQMREQLKPEIELFQKVSKGSPLQVVDAERDGKLTFYLELARIWVSDDAEHRFLARVDTRIQGVSTFEKYIPHLALLVVLTLVASVLWLLYTLRHSVISPLLKIRLGIERSKPIELPNDRRIPQEIRFIAQRFDIYLEQSAEMTEELRRRAALDPLTGLLNRGELVRSFAELRLVFKREKLWMGVAFIDLDNFKAYNDVYGHDAGDRALQAFANIMRGAFQRPTDRIIRYGGEEFVVLFGCDSEQHAIDLAESARADFEEAALEHKGNPPYDVMTLSCGLVVFEAAQEVILETVLRLADEELYTSKSSDRNALNFRSLG